MSNIVPTTLPSEIARSIVEADDKLDAVRRVVRDGPATHMPHGMPLPVALSEFINDAVFTAWERRAIAEVAQRRACGSILPSERDLVLRPLPPEPARVIVSPDTLFAILNHDDDLAQPAPGGEGWILTGCGLPIEVDYTTRTGFAYRVEGEPEE